LDSWRSPSTVGACPGVGFLAISFYGRRMPWRWIPGDLLLQQPKQPKHQNQSKTGILDGVYVIAILKNIIVKYT